MEFFKALLALFMSMLSIFNIFEGPHEITNPTTRKDFEYLEYPAGAIINPKDAGLTLNDYKSRADDDGDELYKNTQGYSDINGIIDSPYFTAHVEGKRIPVYATPVFVGTTQKGELHSFCEIYVDTRAVINYEFQLSVKDFSISSVKVFPIGTGISIINSGSTVNAKINKLGTYTFVFNETDQVHGFTLFVRQLVDEDAEIKKYQDMGYNVVPVEKGFHSSDAYFDFCGWNNTVFYLKRGSYLLSKHTYDINSDDDNYNNTSKQDTDLMNAGHLPMGLNRCPYLNLTSCNNVKIVGSGVVDLSHLDRAERRGIVIAYASNIEISGIKFINSPEWTFITYDSENITIKDVDIFGYRQNSDAFAICNTRNATIDNSFCRSGDDLFDVKAAGGRPEAISKNITFTNCTAWNGKARCFGICGEVEMAISDVAFKDSTVVFHDATWDINRIPALAIVVEIPGGSIENVTYDNIYMHSIASRPIGCLIYNSDIQNFSITGVKYKNITYSSANHPNRIASNGKSTNKIQADFEDIYYNGMKITDVNSGIFEYDNCATITIK